MGALPCADHWDGTGSGHRALHIFYLLPSVSYRRSQRHVPCSLCHHLPRNGHPGNPGTERAAHALHAAVCRILLRRHYNVSVTGTVPCRNLPASGDVHTIVNSVCTVASGFYPVCTVASRVCPVCTVASGVCPVCTVASGVCTVACEPLVSAPLPGVMSLSLGRLPCRVRRLSSL